MGYSIPSSHLEKHLEGERGFLNFKAPEEIDGEGVLKSDVWSLGITLIELAEGKNLFENCSKETFQHSLKKEPAPSLNPSKWSAAFVDFVSKCLVKDVNERWSVSALMDVRACERV